MQCVCGSPSNGGREGATGGLQILHISVFYQEGQIEFQHGRRDLYLVEESESQMTRLPISADSVVKGACDGDVVGGGDDAEQSRRHNFSKALLPRSSHSSSSTTSSIAPSHPLLFYTAIELQSEPTQTWLTTSSLASATSTASIVALFYTNNTADHRNLKPVAYFIFR
ncbi:hypothetical protein L2E82_10278 [Cichorium intybus]|uniref:Uncharacterized protein n=1 Tax=Cichorium intybus TaxID=13427 RepID=A0ACB9GB46_CICIN|nr:hypothetical protein L2E82_10278 [Cichorium intybus]